MQQKVGENLFVLVLKVSVAAAVGIKLWNNIEKFSVLYCPLELIRLHCKS